MAHFNHNASTGIVVTDSLPKPDMWPGMQSIQWGCVLMHLLGEKDLKLLPLLLNGSRPPETSQPAWQFQQAIRNARELVGSVPTRRAVQRAAYDLVQHGLIQGYDPSFRIDPATLQFELADGHQVRLEQAVHTLQSTPALAEHGLKLAPWGDLVAQVGTAANSAAVRVRVLAMPIAPIPQYNLDQKPDRELRVTMTELLATAADLDRLDEQAGPAKWAAEAWQKRLQKIIRLQQCEVQGLTDTDTLNLANLKHLIGLPGAGKTTLITLLCAHLARIGKRVAVFFTSIETAREYLEKLTRYDVATALLMGRSADTHRQHADRLAELIGADSRDRGFSRTRTGAELLAQTCPLPAFALDQGSAWSAWPAQAAPCERLLVAGDDSGTRHLCPLWGNCGRVRNQRDLVTASVWLGHVRSADTTVPYHATDKSLTYFELIGQTFDLTIFDEVDEAQKSLDELGSRTLHLSGTDDSEHMRSQSITSQVLTGRRSLHDAMPLFPYQTISNLFERHLLRFYQEIVRLLPPPGQAAELRWQDDQAAILFNQLESRPLTTNFLVRLALAKSSQPVNSAQRSARYAFWDSALYSAFYRDTSSEWPRTAELYQDLPFGTEANTQQEWQRLRDAFASYLHAFPTNIYLTAEFEALTECFARLVAPTPAAELASLARVLVVVGFTVATYQQLSGITRPLVQAGWLSSESARHESSRSLQMAVPRSLLGIFSSVRFGRGSEGTGVVVDYLMLESAPRLLLHRLHERGTNVLLASATSWLPDSPAYHVDVPPSYVLLPRQQQETKLRLQLLPIRPLGPPLPGQATRPALRFSGAGSDQLTNLREMVRQLASKPERDRLSILERATMVRQTPAPHRRPRKCALVVNSYDQVVEVLRTLRQANPSLARLSRGVVKQWPEEASLRDMCVLRGQVEALGHEEELLVVVFPLFALGRGINIVFHTDTPTEKDPDSGTAALGSLYFLTRPHPVINDLSLMLSRVAEQTQSFDKLDFTGQTLDQVAVAYAERRRDLYQDTMQLLSQPLQASRLPPRYMKAFAANLLIPVLQTIGRAIRGSRPADVYFVDAAWAPNSVDGGADTIRTSVLVVMQQLLRDYMQTADPGQQAVLRALYQPFADAFADIEGLNVDSVGVNEGSDERDQSSYNYLEDQGD